MRANRAAKANLPGDRSVRSRQRRIPEPSSSASDAMIHLHDGAGSNAHEGLRGVFKSDSHWESLGDVDPILRRLNVWHEARQVNAIVGQNAKAHALYEDRKSTRLNSSHLGISYAV